MKAAVWTAKDTIELREIDRPEPKAGEVGIKVTGCGVCGTDVHICAGEVPLAKPPQVLGHEICGEVVSCGEGVTKFAPGQRVCVDPVVGCGCCVFCSEGKTNLCASPTIIGYARCGGFAQFTTVPASHLCALPGSVDSKGGIIAETLACVLNGYDRLNMRAGRSVMVLGAGSVGLLWTQLVRRSVSARVVQTEIVAGRRAAALKLGADVALDPNKPGFEREVLALEPEGVDYIVDASGNAAALQQAIPLLRKGGTLMVFGVCPEEERISISPYDMFARELSIIGAKMPPGTLHRAVRTLEAGVINCDGIVTTTLPLDKLPEAIGWFNTQKDEQVKMMIDPWA